jgi:hypothetical protein
MERTWAMELEKRAYEVMCTLDALSRVEWTLDDDYASDEARARARAELVQGLRGAKRSIRVCLVEEHLEPPSYKTMEDLPGYWKTVEELIEWKREAREVCFESQALIGAIAGAAHAKLAENDAAEFSHALEGIERQLGALAEGIECVELATLAGATPEVRA